MPLEMRDEWKPIGFTPDVLEQAEQGLAAKQPGAGVCLRYGGSIVNGASLIPHTGSPTPDRVPARPS
jgi:hypothetical protein